MDLSNQTLGDRSAVAQITADELEGVAVVEQLADIVGVGLGDRLSSEQPFGLLDG